MSMLNANVISLMLIGWQFNYADLKVCLVFGSDICKLDITKQLDDDSFLFAFLITAPTAEKWSMDR